MKLNKAIFIFSLIAISCNTNIVYEDYKTFENQIWNADSSVFFNHSFRDTICNYQFVIKVRHTTDYEFQNLFLFIKTEETDTLELMLANKEGAWIGRGIGDVREMEFLYRKNKKIPKKGDFIFEIEQAMRYGKLEKIQSLRNIQAIGLSIYKEDE